MSSLTLIVAVFACCVIVVTEAQFPNACHKNLTNPSTRYSRFFARKARSGICCPIPEGFSEPCGGPGRGSCADVNVTTESDYYNDERWLWPNAYISKHCKCEPGFWGYACQECDFGLTGENCTEVKTSVRRDLSTLNGTEKKQLVEIFLQAKTQTFDEYGFILNYTKPSDDESNISGMENGILMVNMTLYDYFTALHYYATRTTDSTQKDKVSRRKQRCENERKTNLEPERPDYSFDCAHAGPAFLPWHRQLLRWFERELQKMSGIPDFTIPYWNWASKGNYCEPCTQDLFGATNETDDSGYLETSSPFSDWKEICHNYTNQTLDCRRCDVSVQTTKLTRKVGKTKGFEYLPTLADVEFALSHDDYDIDPFTDQANTTSFRSVLEGFVSRKGEDGRNKSNWGLHNGVHRFLNDTTTMVSAVSDPIFWLSHSFVDLIYETWIRKYNATYASLPNTTTVPPAHNRTSNLVGFFPPVALYEVHADSRWLGYDYTIPLAPAGLTTTTAPTTPAEDTLTTAQTANITQTETNGTVVIIAQQTSVVQTNKTNSEGSTSTVEETDTKALIVAVETSSTENNTASVFAALQSGAPIGPPPGVLEENWSGLGNQPGIPAGVPVVGAVAVLGLLAVAAGVVFRQRRRRMHQRSEDDERRPLIIRNPAWSET